MFLKLLFTSALIACAITGFSQHKPDHDKPAKIFMDANEFGHPKRVTRSVILTDKENYLFQKPALETSFMNILLNGIQTGAIKAYQGDDDSVLLTPEQLALLLKDDTSLPPRLIPDSVTKISIKEEWTFQREKGRMLVRITDIAPIVKVTDTAGMIQEQPVFWLHYADIRDYLATQKVRANSKNKNTRNLSDVIDGRYFSSEVVSAPE